MRSIFARIGCAFKGHDIEWTRDVVKHHRLWGTCMNCGARFNSLDPVVLDTIDANLGEGYPEIKKFLRGSVDPRVPR